MRRYARQRLSLFDSRVVRAACALWLTLSNYGVGCGGAELLGQAPAERATAAGTESSGGSRAAAGDSNLTGDAGATGGMQSSSQDLGSFGEPTLVAELSAPRSNDSDPAFTADLCEIYFTSTRSGNADLWRALRDSPDVPWNEPTRVLELSSEYVDDTPAVSEDGLKIWFASERPASHAKKNIWTAVRESRDAVWPPPVEVSELNSDAAELSPAVAASNTLLAFASDRTGGSASDIFLSTWSGKAWGTPALVAELRTNAQDWDPFLGAGGLQIFFSSTTTGAGDLYRAERSSLAAPFDPPQLMTEISSGAIDSDPALSPDLRLIMFSSNRLGPQAIFEARR